MFFDIFFKKTNCTIQILLYGGPVTNQTPVFFIRVATIKHAYYTQADEPMCVSTIKNLLITIKILQP